MKDRWRKTTTAVYILMVGRPCDRCKGAFIEDQVVYRRERPHHVDFLCEGCYGRLPAHDKYPLRPIRKHLVKSWPEQFEAVANGSKRHEVRVNDRGYQVGDMLLLSEWNPGALVYTHRHIIARITYITEGGTFGLPDGLAVLSIAVNPTVFLWTPRELSIWASFEETREEVPDAKAKA